MQKIVGFTWRSVSIHGMAKLLGKEDNAQRLESCTMSWNRAKQSMRIAIGNNSLIWTMQCSKNDQNGASIRNSDIAGRISVPSLRTSATLWKGMYCCTRHIHRIWLLLIITCSNRWRIAWLSYSRLILKKCKIGWMNGFGSKMQHFKNCKNVM